MKALVGWNTFYQVPELINLIVFFTRIKNDMEPELSYMGLKLTYMGPKLTYMVLSDLYWTYTDLYGT